MLYIWHNNNKNQADHNKNNIGFTHNKNNRCKRSKLIFLENVAGRELRFGWFREE